MHVASTTLFEGPAPDYVEFRDHIASRLHLVPRFRQKLRFVPVRPGPPGLGRRPAPQPRPTTCATPRCPRPGSEEQLRNLAARIFSQQLDRSKPLWELWLVEGLEGGRFAIVGKTHHCLVDGVSGVDITTVLFDLEKDPPDRRRPPREQWVPEPEPTGAAAPRRGAGRARRQPPRGRPRLPPRCSAARAGRARKLLETAGRRRHLRLGRAWRRSGHPLQRRDRPAPPLRLGPRLARRPQAGQGRARRDGQRRRPRRRRRRARAATCAPAATRPPGLEMRAMVPVSVRTADQHGALGNQVSRDDGPAAGLVRGPRRAPAARDPS